MFILSSVHQDFEAIKQSLISFYTFCRGCIQLYKILEKKRQYQYQSNNTQLMSSSMLFTLYVCFKLRTSICLDLIRCILYRFLFFFYTYFFVFVADLLAVFSCVAAPSQLTSNLPYTG